MYYMYLHFFYWVPLSIYFEFRRSTNPAYCYCYCLKLCSCPLSLPMRLLWRQQCWLNAFQVTISISFNPTSAESTHIFLVNFWARRCALPSLSYHNADTHRRQPHEGCVDCCLEVWRVQTLETKDTQVLFVFVRHRRFLYSIVSCCVRGQDILTKYRPSWAVQIVWLSTVDSRCHKTVNLFTIYVYIYIQYMHLY